MVIYRYLIAHSLEQQVELVIYSGGFSSPSAVLDDDNSAVRTVLVFECLCFKKGSK